MASLPPRRKQALPLFRHSEAMSTVTLGRALVDGADDAQGHPPPPDDEAVGQHPLVDGLAHGVGQAGHGAHVAGDAGQAVGGEARGGPAPPRRCRPRGWRATSSALAARISSWRAEQGLGDGQEGAVLDVGATNGRGRGPPGGRPRPWPAAQRWWWSWRLSFIGFRFFAAPRMAEAQLGSVTLSEAKGLGWGRPALAQVPPLRVRRFDERNLPAPEPPLDLLLPSRSADRTSSVDS